MDITSLVTAFGGIKHASDLAKAIKDAGYTLEKAEVKLQIAELISALADAKIGLSEVKELLDEKDLEIRKLKKELDAHDSLVYEAPYYWRVDGEKRDGPFCQKCYDSDGKLIRLQKMSQGAWFCEVCNSSFRDDSYVQPKTKVRVRSTRSRWMDGYTD